MREFTNTDGVEVRPDDNVVNAFVERAAVYPNHPCVGVRAGDGFRIQKTSAVLDVCQGVGKGLIGLGLKAGDRVCILSKTRVEWTYLDFGAWFAGCVPVPIYESSSPDQIEWIVKDSGARAIVCEDAELRARFDKVAAKLPDCKHVFVIDEGGLDEILAAGKKTTDKQLTERSGGIKHSDVATIVYTSGTTGMPKGCVLTHGNVIFELRQVVHAMVELFADAGSTLMFLPLAHILGRVVNMACLTTGVTIYYSAGLPHLSEEFPLAQPTWVFAVPRVFEKLYAGARAKAGDGLKAGIFNRATDVAIAYSRERERGGVSILTQVQHKALSPLVYSKIQHGLGGRLRYAISGGAPLGERLGHFFSGLGLTVLEGYGLTENTAAATVNTPKHLRIGSVGQPIPDTSVRIADDGEVLIKGGHVFKGYWKNDEATVQTLDQEGWFRSGDIGKLDDDGYLFITGRKKELIVTAGGKNVAPAPLEDKLRAHPLISQALVIGDAKPFIAVLITLDNEALFAWSQKNGKDVESDEVAISALREDPDVRAQVKAAVDNANKAVSHAEAIKEFRILDHDFTIESGEMTPSMKVKRNVVLAQESATVEDIYSKKKT